MGTTARYSEIITPNCHGSTIYLRQSHNVSPRSKFHYIAIIIIFHSSNHRACLYKTAGVDHLVNSFPYCVSPAFVLSFNTLRASQFFTKTPYILNILYRLFPIHTRLPGFSITIDWHIYLPL